MSLFLVKDRRFGKENYVFSRKDPRADGYTGDVIEGVTLDYDWNSVHAWPEGSPRPVPILGIDPDDGTHYEVFKSPDDLRAKKYIGTHSDVPFVVYSWSDYRNRYYPEPEQYARSMTRDEWFEFLEEADSAARIRRQAEEPEELAKGAGRDRVAEWVARRHMGADGGIRQIWYLGSGSPGDEIRLLEVSDRFNGEGTKVEPIDFGLDIAGARYKLLVADVSEDHLDRIKSDPGRTLPDDWTIENATIWGRRELMR